MSKKILSFNFKIATQYCWIGWFRLHSIHAAFSFRLEYLFVASKYSKKLRRNAWPQLFFFYFPVFFLCKSGMIVCSDLQSRIQSTEKQTEMGCSIYSEYNSYNITESLPETRNYRDSSFQSVTRSTLVGSILSLVDLPGCTAAVKRINCKQENIALPKFSAIRACADFSVSLTLAIKSEDVFGREKTPKQGQ